LGGLWAGGRSPPPRATALLAGTGTFPDRLPGRLLPRLARSLIGPFVLGGNVVRIPWEEVDGIGARVRLAPQGGRHGPRPRRRRTRSRDRPTAAGKAEIVMTDEPHLKLSDLQRCKVVDESGNRIGHLFDLATDLAGPDEPPVVRRLLVGRAGLARRLGLWRARADELSVDDVVAIRDGQVVVRLRPAD